MAKEIEVKFRVKDLDSVKSKLSKLGLSSEGEKLQRSIAFGHESIDLRGQGKLLRLRDEGGKVSLTFKKKIDHDKLNVREEIEVYFDDYDNMKLILEKLDFNESFVYEKYRETFKGDGFEIVIDRPPFIGTYLEIEGDEEKIYDIAEKLDFDVNDSIKISYRIIFKEFCKKNNLKIKNMTFEEESLKN